MKERIPNEIYFVSNYEEFMEICDKLKEVKDCELTKEKLFNYMYAGLHNKKTFSFASYDGEMNGCIVLSVGKNLIDDLAVYVIFIWIDKHSPKLWLKYMKFVEDVAREFKAKKIIGSTKRNAEAIDRKLEKFGYKVTYNVLEKEIKE